MLEEEAGTGPPGRKSVSESLPAASGADDVKDAQPTGRGSRPGEHLAEFSVSFIAFTERIIDS